MEKRGELRILRDICFFVHINECKEDHDLVGVSVACEAIDFSTHGLHV
ncbi:MAG: hypothetical protein ACI9CE_003358, partial [Flavobacterium sp.]|jgi:hypothetical protein